MTAPVDPEALVAIRRRIREIEALLDGAPVEPTDDRSWPPDNIDLRDPYWEWMTLDQAADAGPHKKTRLQSIRFDVSKTEGKKRWFSLRRIWQIHGAGLATTAKDTRR